jgi:hypothetical protein
MYNAPLKYKREPLKKRQCLAMLMFVLNESHLSILFGQLSTSIQPIWKMAKEQTDAQFSGTLTHSTAQRPHKTQSYNNFAAR